MKSLAAAALSLLYPHGCMVCRCALPDGQMLCEACDERLPRLEPPYCQVCSQPFDGEITQDFTCATCEGRRFHFRHAISTRRNTGKARQLIHRFKYQRQFHLRRLLGEWLCECLGDKRLEPFDLIVPVPLHPVRLREREFNQAEALGEILAARAARPLVPVLRRTRRTESQTHFDRDRRLANLRGAFAVQDTAAVAGASILLIDDVFTTGSTVDECAKCLLDAGAASVQVATAARS